MARFLDLGPDDNVVTIATDGFDRYPSVLANLEKRRGPLGRSRRWFEEDFPRRRRRRDSGRAPAGTEAAAVRATRKQVWTGFGYSHAYLESMKSQSFWDAEFDKIEAIDAALLQARRGWSRRPGSSERWRIWLDTQHLCARNMGA